MIPRVGIGYDIHRLVEGRKLFLGGVEIPFVKGLLGHSDADALLHAICDAILGAAGLGDIGEHFPNTESQYHGISSIKLLEAVRKLAKESKYSIGNVDCVVIAEEPNLLPFKKKMAKVIAQILGLEESSVSVKAKTAEGLGDIGRKEAIAAYAVVTLIKGD